MVIGSSFETCSSLPWTRRAKSLSGGTLALSLISLPVTSAWSNSSLRWSVFDTSTKMCIVVCTVPVIVILLSRAVMQGAMSSDKALMSADDGEQSTQIFLEGQLTSLPDRE